VVRPVLMISTWQPDHDNGANAACRDTYLYTWGSWLSHAFVFDKSRKIEDLLPGEIRVEVDSGLTNTSFKTKFAVQAAYNEGFSHVCYCPTDCYIVVPRLLRNLYEHIEAGHDYWGFHTYDEHHIGGGSAYWLSRRAMEAVLAFDGYPDYEDRWVGSACRHAGMEAVHDERYRSIEQPIVEGVVTMHLSKATGNYDPQTMKDLHLRVNNGEMRAAGENFL
jgi:hypothetical protein